MRIFTELDMMFSKGSSCVALGLFDGLHSGHRQVIHVMVEQAKKLRKIPCIFTFSGVDEFPKPRCALISPRQFNMTTEALGVETIICPDFSTFRHMEPEEFVKEVLLNRLGAKAVFCGEDFRFGKNASGNATLLAELCGTTAETYIIPMVEQDGGRISSSRIRDLIQNGDMEQAGRLLGRPFAIDFEVVRGKALGRTIGFPTINQPFPESFVEPKFGVYATTAILNGKQYKSLTNVGVKPTVGSDYVLAETYIHDFSGDLYDQRVDIQFLKFIRPEKKFSSIDELKAQIKKDQHTQLEAGHNTRLG